jgi:hypothetical protein
MNAAPQIHGPYRSVSGTKLIEAAGASLQAIKHDDGLTDADLGEELGKSEDQGSAYRKATSEMSMTTFLRACRRWNGRFANPVFALIGLKLVPLESMIVCARQGLTVILTAATSLTRHLEDGVLSDAELLESRAEIEAAGAVFDGLRQRLAGIDGRN